MNKISWSFRGTFSANNIPKFKDNFFSLIVNLSNEGETGTHFIAIFITENKILYFDSLGSLLINPNIKKSIKAQMDDNNLIQFRFFKKATKV